MPKISNSLERVKVRKREPLDRALDSVMSELIRRSPERALEIIRQLIKRGEISLAKKPNI